MQGRAGGPPGTSSRQGQVRAYRGAGGGAGRGGEDVLAQQFPLAEPPPSFLHSPEGVTGRKGWKEGKGKKGGRGKKSGSSSEEAGRPELPVGCGHGSRPWGEGVAQLLSPAPHSQIPAGPWAERGGKKKALGGQSCAKGAELWSGRPGFQPHLCHLLCDPGRVA